MLFKNAFILFYTGGLNKTPELLRRTQSMPNCGSTCNYGHEMHEDHSPSNSHQQKLKCIWNIYLHKISITKSYHRLSSLHLTVLCSYGSVSEISYGTVMINKVRETILSTVRTYSRIKANEKSAHLDRVLWQGRSLWCSWPLRVACDAVRCVGLRF